MWVLLDTVLIVKLLLQKFYIEKTGITVMNR